MMMNDQQLKRAWIANLRSGKFTQGHKRLVGEDGHCCLGVLCETMGFKPFLAGHIDRMPPESLGYEIPAEFHDGRMNAGKTTRYLSAKLTKKLLIFLGISPADQEHLIDMNDLHRSKFPDIAKWIEENL